VPFVVKTNYVFENNPKKEKKVRYRPKFIILPIFYKMQQREWLRSWTNDVGLGFYLISV